MNPWMDSIISHFQPNFVSNRQIQDSILIAHGPFHFLKSDRYGSKGNMAIKLDLNKAYGRVEWDFLWAVLPKMGFYSKWVDLIYQCVSTVSFSVVVNRSNRRLFVPSRGLGQGDPLSPYLFLCVQDALSMMICRAVESNNL